MVRNKLWNSVLAVAIVFSIIVDPFLGAVVILQQQNINTNAHHLNLITESNLCWDHVLNSAVGGAPEQSVKAAARQCALLKLP